MNYQPLPPTGNLFDTARTLRQPGMRVAAALDCSALTTRTRNDLVRTLLAAHTTKGWRSAVRHHYEALCKTAGLPVVIALGGNITLLGPLPRLDAEDYARVKDFYETDTAVAKMRNIHYYKSNHRDTPYDVLETGSHNYSWRSAIYFYEKAFAEQATEVITASLLRQHPEYAALAEQVKAGAVIPITL